MIKTNALKYLGCYGKEISPDFDALIDVCIKEVKELSQPAFIHKRVHLKKHPLTIEEGNISLAYHSLETLFEDCEEILVIAVTLGIGVDRQSKYYSVENMSKMSVFDAVASSYVEYVCDEFEKELHLQKRTMRFCPGYADVPITLNKYLANLLQCDKHIGVYVQKSDILLPQKSMIALIGLGDSKYYKSCEKCIKIEDCEFRKGGTRCYKKD